MTDNEKIIRLLNDIRDSNSELLSLLQNMKVEDKKEYSDKIYQSIKKAQGLVALINI